MYIVIFCSFLAILLAYLDSRRILNGGMKWGFILVTLLAAIHYDYGNDYMSYYYGYLSFVQYPSFVSVLDKEIYRDIGWTAINYLFQYLGGFFSLVAVISIFEGVVFYKTIKRYLPRDLWWFGTAIYLLSTSYYLLNFSMLRQGFVVALFLSLFPLIEKRKWWIAAPILYVASFIHGSALVLVPFALWGYLPIKRSGMLVLIYITVLVLLYLSSTLIGSLQYLAFEATDEFERYNEVYSDHEHSNKFGIGFVISLIPFILSYVYLAKEKEKRELKLMAALFCISAFFTPLARYIPMVGRVGFYFGVSSVIILPLAYEVIKNRLLKNGLIVMFFVIKLYDYFLFFNSEVFSEHYSEFHTIFSQIF